MARYYQVRFRLIILSTLCCFCPRTHSVSSLFTVVLGSLLTGVTESSDIVQRTSEPCTAQRNHQVPCTLSSVGRKPSTFAREEPAILSPNPDGGERRKTISPSLVDRTSKKNALQPPQTISWTANLLSKYKSPLLIMDP